MIEFKTNFTSQNRTIVLSEHLTTLLINSKYEEDIDNVIAGLINKFKGNHLNLDGAVNLNFSKLDKYIESVEYKVNQSFYTSMSRFPKKEQEYLLVTYKVTGDMTKQQTDILTKAITKAKKLGIFIAIGTATECETVIDISKQVDAIVMMRQNTEVSLRMVNDVMPVMLIRPDRGIIYTNPSHPDRQALLVNITK